MRARTLGALMTAAVLLIGCQPSGKGGGGGAPDEGAAARPVERETGYNPANQPPINRLGTPGPVLEGGRVARPAEGPNRGAHGNPPPEGYRGSGSTYNPPPGAVLKKQKLGASPAPRTPPPSR